MARQLHYSEIALKPKKCIVESREDCSTQVKLGDNFFKIPVYPANMKSVVDINTCKFCAKNNIFYTMHRFGIDVIDFIYQMKGYGYISSISTGVNQDSYDELKKIYNEPLAVDYITIDVANAWSEKTHRMVDFIKDKFPETFLIVGNVATSEAVKEIQKWGVGGIKCGIAGGCFVAGVKIITSKGVKNIEDIAVGDYVLTHTGSYKPVVATTNRLEEDKIILINDNIKCTLNHDIYVLHKQYKDKVTDNNIDKYAEWISACKLTMDYYLLKIKEDKSFLR